MKILILGIITILFLFQLVLIWLEKRSEERPTPGNVKDVYDKETYEKWKRYHSETVKVGFYGAIAEFGINLILFGTNAFAAFASLFPENDFFQMFAVILLLSLSELLLIPFSWYTTMVIEEEYGFNHTTTKLFVSDTIKSSIISLLMSTALGVILVLLHHLLGMWIGLLFAVVLMAISLIMGFLSPYLTRIFNRFTPLEDGSLRTKLVNLLEKNGYQVKEIEVMDASSRSGKLNAYFTGIGKTKTIVLYDTLIEKMNEDEICAVFAHEMGHGLHKDTLKMQLFGFLQMFILAMLLWMNLSFPAFWQRFGFAKLNYGFALLLVFTVQSPLLDPFLGLISNFISRKAEYLADAKAVDEGYGEALISALKTLARENFADLSPDPLLVKLVDNHPPLSKRILRITEDGRG